MSPARQFTRLPFALLLLLCAFAGRAAAFGFEDVAQKARRLAEQPYRKPASNLPDELQKLPYDRYRDIRYKPETSLWRKEGLPFEAAFFHQGGYYEQPVRINEIAGATVREMRFDPAQFTYGANSFDPNRMRGLGYAGFRLHYPVNKKTYKDEVLAFLGASYFRALGKGQLYGASSRALAVDTAVSSGEEFPSFVEFWLERPAPGASQITVYGLVDSARLAGAYRFILRPGIETVIDVKARIFLREAVGVLGLAPMTSMYLYGENQPAGREDFRPEVHDSDGLSIHARNGEWIWRPLQNPKRLLVTSFALKGVDGFGLMQRDRDFSHYEDLEARYQLRPGIWVEPVGDWGPGRVELVQIPVPDETNDNIVAYWVPEKQPAPGQAFDIEYRQHWQGDNFTRPPTAWVEQSRRGRGYVKTPDGSIAFMIDFKGPALKALPAGAKPEIAAAADGNGQIIETNVYRNDMADGWRAALRLRRLDNGKPVELRVRLRGNDNNWTETWSYILPPE